jgi:hypothetical protein
LFSIYSFYNVHGRVGYWDGLTCLLYWDLEGFLAELYRAFTLSVFPFSKVKRCEVEENLQHTQAARIATVARALCTVVFNAGQGGPIEQLQTSPTKTTTWNASVVDASFHSTTDHGAFTSKSWLEGMHNTAYVNANNSTFWNVDPASQTGKTMESMCLLHFLYKKKGTSKHMI